MVGVALTDRMKAVELLLYAQQIQQPSTTLVVEVKGVTPIIQTTNMKSGAVCQEETAVEDLTVAPAVEEHQERDSLGQEFQAVEQDQHTDKAVMAQA